jgi:Stress responsive A/B Barrel Domain
MKNVHHLVLVKFKPGEDRKAPALFAALQALKMKLPGMLGYRFGTNVSPEGLNHGYTHGFVMTFSDAAARDQYLVHPDHEEVKSTYLPHVEDVIVFDFEG